MLPCLPESSERVRHRWGTRAELRPLCNSVFFFWSLEEMMEPTLPFGDDVRDWDQLRLPAERVGKLETRRRPSRHRPGDPFIKRPVPHAWIASDCRLPGAGLRVAITSRFLCCRFRSESRSGLDAIASGLLISTRSARRGFHAVELAGLLAVQREPGCKLAVSVLDLPERLGCRESHFKLRRSVGSWPVGSNRLISS
jgi:hypothetical protein